MHLVELLVPKLDVLYNISYHIRKMISFSHFSYKLPLCKVLLTEILIMNCNWDFYVFWFRSVRPCVRDNLKLSLISKKSNEHAFDLMIESIKNDFANQSGIIYSITKSNCVKLAEFLVNRGYSATFYHSELPKEEQKCRLAKWMAGDVNVWFSYLFFVCVFIFNFPFWKLKMIVNN